MKKFGSVLLLLFLSSALVFPCGPGYITPIFEYEHAPDNPYQNFAAGKIGVLKPSYRRVVLFAAYRYLNNGNFSAEEQNALVDVWKAEFDNKDFQHEDVGESVKLWVEKRKEIVGKEEKLSDIYTEREYGGYDFFPNCTKGAFETAAQTLADRIASYGSDSKDVSDWLAAQDKVFTNCASGKQAPEEANSSMPEWLQKDRAYQIAAADFYSLDYETAKNHFREISQDTNSPWQETADYLVGRTLIRQASLSKDEAKSNQFYTEAEQHLQVISAKSPRFHDSADRFLNLIKYRIHPKERLNELAQNLSSNGTTDFRQDLIDYNWLMDKFEKETLEAEDKRVEEETKRKSIETFGNSNIASNAQIPPSVDSNTTNTDVPDGYLSINVYTEDYSKNWAIVMKADASDEEAFVEAQRVIGQPLTDKMKEQIIFAKKSAYTSRYSQNYQASYQGGYFGETAISLSLMPEYLRQNDLTDWLFTFQIEGAEAYLYSLSKFKQTGSDLWLLTALSKADANSSELNRLLKAAAETNRFSNAYPTIAYHEARILLEQKKSAEAKKLLDEIINSSIELPISSRNSFLELRMSLSETLEDFLKFAQRKPFAFDFDGTSGTIDEIISGQKGWYNAEYETKSKEVYESEVDENFKEEKLWQDRFMFDDKTVELINEHFPLPVLIDAEKSEAIPDYLRKRFAAAIWTRAALLEDYATAAKIAPEVVKYEPETEELMSKFLAAKTLPQKKYAALYLILKTIDLTPYVTSGTGTSSESYKAYSIQWWCQPYGTHYDEQTDSEVEDTPPPKPLFLTKPQSDAAQNELKKLKTIGDAPKFLGGKILEWAKIAPTDKRVPESLYIVWEGNGFDKYGCGDNAELHDQIATFLKKRYPRDEWTQKLLDEEQGTQ
jgi:hypothetical protein